MARLDNWQTNLSQLIEEKRKEPFEFGTFDCSLWAGFAVEAVTGTNLYAPYLGKYTTALGALRKLKQNDDVSKPVEFFQKHFGEIQPIAFARKGDIVLAYTGNEQIDLPLEFEEFGPTIGICYGHTSLFLGEDGLVEVETLKLDACLWVS